MGHPKVATAGPDAVGREVGQVANAVRPTVALATRVAGRLPPQGEVPASGLPRVAPALAVTRRLAVGVAPQAGRPVRPRPRAAPVLETVPEATDGRLAVAPRPPLLGRVVAQPQPVSRVATRRPHTRPVGPRPALPTALDQVPVAGATVLAVTSAIARPVAGAVAAPVPALLPPTVVGVVRPVGQGVAVEGLVAVTVPLLDAVAGRLCPRQVVTRPRQAEIVPVVIGRVTPQLPSFRATYCHEDGGRRGPWRTTCETRPEADTTSSMTTARKTRTTTTRRRACSRPLRTGGGGHTTSRACRRTDARSCATYSRTTAKTSMTATHTRAGKWTGSCGSWRSSRATSSSGCSATVRRGHSKCQTTHTTTSGSATRKSGRTRGRRTATTSTWTGGSRRGGSLGTFATGSRWHSHATQTHARSPCSRRGSTTGRRSCRSTGRRRTGTRRSTRFRGATRSGGHGGSSNGCRTSSGCGGCHGGTATTRWRHGNSCR